MDTPIIQKIEVKSVLSKSNLPVCEYSVNPYVGCPHACQYCYASFMKRFTNHPELWGDFLDVKYWPEIKNPQKYAGKELFIGSVTDPYNPQEEIYGRTRALLTQLQGSGAKISIATKSDLILRDLDLIKSFPDARVSWSIDTLDWKTRDAEKTVSAVLDHVKDGDIILMHDLYETAADASDVIVPELIRRGYQLVTVSELASYRGGMAPGNSYYKFRP